MTDLENVWKELLAKIKPKISEVNYKNWMLQLKFLEAKEQTIVLGAPDIFTKDWVVDYYQDIIIQELFNLTQKLYNIEFEITGEYEKSHIAQEEAEKDSLKAILLPDKRPAEKNKNLNPKYAFDRFVVGASNQFAHAASCAAADLPGGHYNPLFIYGGVGLGKTHLLNAVGLKIQQLFPHLRIVYLSAEQFMNELIFSIRFEKMDQFRKKFREDCDVFLIDDVQFIVGKERTVEEFFHTFNTLYESQRQIVVTSDKLPKDLHGLEERLRSRFEWGLIADIQPPDLETRIAILKKKADQSNIYLSDDVAMFLATQIKSNVRELEGSLIRLSAYASLEGVTITEELAKKIFKDIIREKASTCSIDVVQRTVADFYHIKVADLKSPRRLKSITVPRQIAMYLCKIHLSSSYPEIGYKFGGKDHSTVIHSVKKITAQLETDALLKQELETIERSLA